MSGAGSSAGDAIRKGVGMFHGAGESIRGNVNAALDSASGDKNSAAKNQAIATKGGDEMQHGYHHDTSTTNTTGATGTAPGVGITRAETAAQPMSYQPLSTSEYGTQTAGSANSTNLGTKADARESELALRRTQTDGPSSNYGPHSTNVGNKLDPRYDSDLDHRGPGTHGAPPSDGTPTYRCNNCKSTSFGLYHGDKLDPRYHTPENHQRRAWKDDHVPPPDAPAIYRCNNCGSTTFGLYHVDPTDPQYRPDHDHNGALRSQPGQVPAYNPHDPNISKHEHDLSHPRAGHRSPPHTSVGSNPPKYDVNPQFGHGSPNYNPLNYDHDTRDPEGRVRKFSNPANVHDPHHVGAPMHDSHTAAIYPAPIPVTPVTPVDDRDPEGRIAKYGHPSHDSLSTIRGPSVPYGASSAPGHEQPHTHHPAHPNLPHGSPVPGNLHEQHGHHPPHPNLPHGAPAPGHEQHGHHPPHPNLPHGTPNPRNDPTLPIQHHTPPPSLPGTTGSPPGTSGGVHSSALLNRLDPRVDSNTGMRKY